jgi:8-oxo-dGTP pyrophosphatase MutT (NUDIX family)
MALSAFDTLSEQAITDALAHYTVTSQPLSGLLKLKPASVLIPLLRQDGLWQVIFTRRTEKVENHKGQVSFPGGSVDPGDADAIQTALREAEEEIGLSSDSVRILGRMPQMPTGTGFCITPVVGVIHRPVDLKPAVDEVDRIFAVPLVWLAQAGNHEERPYMRTTGVSEMVVFFHPYDDEIIWGITARLIVNFLVIIGIR